MENPNIKTKVVHSQSKAAWNIVSGSWGEKYKIARIPYLVLEDSEITTIKNRKKALLYAQFISKCFNSSDRIIDTIF